MKLCDSIQCTGCGACINICPKDCISYGSDKEGFCNPTDNIDTTRCIECGLCEKTCPALNPAVKHPEGKVYAAFSNDLETRCKSSSGGLFSVLAGYIFEKGGSVFGAAYDDSMVLRHCKASTPEELAPLRGSKYVQSDIGLCFREVKKELEDDKHVLFTGTPCQVAGLLNYLGRKEYPKLITTDLVCHGVPSPLLFSDYLNKLSNSLNIPVEKMKDFSFRKYDGWITSPHIDNFELKKEHNLYTSLFLRNITLRESCYNCQYTSIERTGDITLGDFWGIGDEVPYNHPTGKGVTLLLANSPKGYHVLEQVSPELLLEERELAEAAKQNHQLYQPAIRIQSRDYSYSYLLSHSLKSGYRKFIDTPYIRLRRAAGKLLRKTGIFK